MIGAFLAPIPCTPHQHAPHAQLGFGRGLTVVAPQYSTFAVRTRIQKENGIGCEWVKDYPPIRCTRFVRFSQTSSGHSSAWRRACSARSLTSWAYTLPHTRMPSG